MGASRPPWNDGKIADHEREEGTFFVSDIASSFEAIDRDLPALARSAIKRHLDPSDPKTDAFLETPDGRDQHQVEWHQWGIITHTRVFLRHFDSQVPALLRSWNVWTEINHYFLRRIDGATRWELLRISILLHDIGKFAARTRQGDRFHFAFHERLTGTIIRNEIDLREYGLTPEQVEYVATTAEDHFVLGILRKSARKRGAYDERYTTSRDFRDEALRIKRDHPSDYIEIGVLFLGDSLAKVDPNEGPPRAVSQYDVNILLARLYLEVVLHQTPVADNT